MPDAPGLELIRREINEAHAGAVLETSFDHGQAALIAHPGQVLNVLSWLRDTPGQEYRFLSSLHAADYLPAQPRFGVHYELLNMPRVERLRVKAMLGDPAANGTPGSADGGQSPPTGRPTASLASEPGSDDSGGERAGAEQLPVIQSCVALFPTAEFHEREVYDFFGIVFRGHPDLRRILLPEDYVGWPLRRDYPVGGEPVLFTKDEPASPGWYE
jgi:NADH-quinone oxidoreductase subunit C